MKAITKRLLSAILCLAVLFVGLISTANAALVSTLGGLAVYDTDRDISWLADANAGAGSAFDDGFNTTDGSMTWDNAKAWAANLNVGGITGWRLPSALNANGTGPCFGNSCSDSEMGHLFYNELSGTTSSSILTSGDADLVLFSNVQSNIYWSRTESALNPDGAWNFNFNFGINLANSKLNNFFAWAVHSGE